MNKNQWFVFTVVFCLMSMFFIVDATIQTLMQPTSGVSEALWIRSAIYGSFGVIFFGLFVICAICGYLEKENN